MKLAGSCFRSSAPARGVRICRGFRKSARTLRWIWAFYRKNGLLLIITRSEYCLQFLCNYHWKCYEFSELSQFFSPKGLLFRNLEISKQKQQKKSLTASVRQYHVQCSIDNKSLNWVVVLSGSGLSSWDTKWAYVLYSSSLDYQFNTHATTESLIMDLMLNAVNLRRTRIDWWHELCTTRGCRVVMLCAFAIKPSDMGYLTEEQKNARDLQLEYKNRALFGNHLIDK